MSCFEFMLHFRSISIMNNSFRLYTHIFKERRPLLHPNSWQFFSVTHPEGIIYAEDICGQMVEKNVLHNLRMSKWNTGELYAMTSSITWSNFVVQYLTQDTDSFSVRRTILHLVWNQRYHSPFARGHQLTLRDQV
jgi:hypothetical protein